MEFLHLILEIISAFHLPATYRDIWFQSRAAGSPKKTFKGVT